MSLLADLLSKVKHQRFKRDVPPNLKRVVADSTQRADLIKKLVFLSAFLIIAVMTGSVAVYVYETFIKPAAVKPVLPQPQPQTTKKSDALITEADAPRPVATAPAPAPAPAPSPPPVKVSAPEQPLPGNKTEIVPGKVPDAQTEIRPKRRPRIVRTARMPAPESYLPQATAETGVVAKETKLLSPEKREERDMHLYAARAYESRKDYQQALSNYMRALEIEPGNYMVMNNIAGLMIRMGQYDKALQYARTSLALKEDYSPSLVNMGIVSIKMDNKVDGEKYLTRALGLDPSNRNALLNLAILHEKTGDTDKAYSSFNKLAELGDIQGELGLARIAEKRGNKADAARIYREILSMNNAAPDIKKLASERLSLIEK